MVIALLVAAGMNFSAMVFRQDRTADVQRPGGGPQDGPELYGMVQELCRRANLPLQRCNVIPQEAPTLLPPPQSGTRRSGGDRRSAKRMNREEAMGVFGPRAGPREEPGYSDRSIAATMAGAIMMLADMARWSAIFGGGRRDPEEGGGGGGGLV